MEQLETPVPVCEKERDSASVAVVATPEAQNIHNIL